MFDTPHLVPCRLVSGKGKLGDPLKSDNLYDLLVLYRTFFVMVALYATCQIAFSGDKIVPFVIVCVAGSYGVQSLPLCILGVCVVCSYPYGTDWMAQAL